MRLRSPAALARALAVPGLALLLTGTGRAQTADAALAARSLAATCTSCHGTNGHAQGALPPLAGMPADRMLALLNAYRQGTAPATVMHQITKGYSDDQLRLIARHFEAQAPRR